MAALGGQAPTEPRPFRRRADQTDRAEPGGAQGGVAQRGVLRVIVGHDQDMGAGRQLPEHLLRKQQGAVHVDLRHGVREHAEPFVGEHLRAGVDQVQVEVLARQDACQLQADVPDAEDRHGLHHRQRFEQDGDGPAAALHAVRAGDLVVEGELHHLRLRIGRAGQLARPVDGHRLDVAAADRPPRLGASHDELGAGPAGRVAAYGRHGHEHAGFPARPQPRDRGHPAHVRHCSERLPLPGRRRRRACARRAASRRRGLPRPPSTPPRASPGRRVPR